MDDDPPPVIYEFTCSFCKKKVKAVPENYGWVSRQSRPSSDQSFGIRVVCPECGKMNQRYSATPPE